MCTLKYLDNWTAIAINRLNIKLLFRPIIEKCNLLDKYCIHVFLTDGHANSNFYIKLVLNYIIIYIIISSNVSKMRW